MKHFTYNGPDTNLGRFGLVKDGDTITLTTLEARCVTDDPRFTETEEVKQAPISPALSEAEIAAEAARREALEEANRKALTEELAQMGKDDLLNRAQELRDKGIEIPPIPKTWSKSAIRKEIMKYLGMAERDEPTAGED